PCPFSPWHAIQVFVKSALPSFIAASLWAGGVPRLITVSFGSFVSPNRGEKVLTYSTTAHRSPSLRLCFHGGIGVPGIPSETARKRSTSVGNWPVGVERRRYFASTKFRGLGRGEAAASPLPSPLMAWQAGQFLA